MRGRGHHGGHRTGRRRQCRLRPFPRLVHGEEDCVGGAVEGREDAVTRLGEREREREGGRGRKGEYEGEREGGRERERERDNFELRGGS